MKTLILTFTCLLIVPIAAAQILFETDYSEPSLPFAFSVDTNIYKLSHRMPSEMQITCETVENGFDVFAQPLYVIEDGEPLRVDVSNKGLLTLYVRADSAAILRADLVDTSGVETSFQPKTFFLSGNGEVDTIEFLYQGEDFQRFAAGPPYVQVDSTAIFSIAFMVNPGGLPFQGNIYIDYIRLGKQATSLRSSKQGFHLKVFPNPASIVLRANFNLQSRSLVGHELLDPQGRRLSTIPTTWFNQGENIVEIPIKGLAAGAYFLRSFVNHHLVDVQTFQVE